MQRRSTIPRLRLSDLAALLLVWSALLLLGGFCQYLNSEFYLRHGPFWDSVSYDDLLARIMVASRDHGILEGLSLIDQSTVALPWLEAAPLAQFLSPSRALAIWIQVSWLLVAAGAGYAYFRSVARYSPISAAGRSLFFFFIAGTFVLEGGLADFDYDYLQYTLFCLTGFLYLIALDRRRDWLWALWGVALGLTCLARSTTPVPAALTFGPLLLLDLWRERHALRGVVRRYAIGGLTCLYVCGWFYLNNFVHLYEYYAVWHRNAQPIYPLSAGVDHILNLYRNIGAAGAAGCLLLLALRLGSAFGGREPVRWNLRPLWCCAAPLAGLIGAGAEPVLRLSELAAFGIILFALAPVLPLAPAQRMRLQTTATLLALGVAAGAGMTQGLRIHQDETGQYVHAGIPPRAGIAAVDRCIIDDMATDTPGQRSFSTLYSGSLNSDVILNSLVFDAGLPALVLPPEDELAVRVGAASLGISPYRIDRIVTGIQWASIDGAGDAEKLDTLAGDMAAQVDYIIAPTDPDKLWGITLNRHAGEITARIAAQVSLRQICPVIDVTRTESVVLYRNETRRQASAP